MKSILLKLLYNDGPYNGMSDLHVTYVGVKASITCQVKLVW